eukprot:3500653-Amphidinium_carterae.1
MEALVQDEADAWHDDVPLLRLVMVNGGATLSPEASSVHTKLHTPSLLPKQNVLLTPKKPPQLQSQRFKLSILAGLQWINIERKVRKSLFRMSACLKSRCFGLALVSQDLFDVGR